MQQILIIEDDRALNQGLCKALKTDNNSMQVCSGLYASATDRQIVSCENLKDAKEQLLCGMPALILLDINLPDGSGLDFLQSVKRDCPDCPVILLTANDTDGDIVNGLELGADDYIVKPFLPQELILRIYAVLRRSYKEDNPLVVLDGCTVDFDRAEVYKGNEIFFLTAKEHMLLKTLARNEGKIITVDALCEALWGDNPFGYENSLNAHVRRVREKIETDPSNPKSLITIKGLGYKLIMRK